MESTKLYDLLNSINDRMTDDELIDVIENINKILQYGYTPFSQELILAIQNVESIGPVCLANMFAASNISEKIMSEYKLIYLLNVCVCVQSKTKYLLESIFIVLNSDPEQMNIRTKNGYNMEKFAIKIMSGELFAIFALFDLNIWDLHKSHKNCIEYILENEHILADFKKYLMTPLDGFEKKQKEILQKLKEYKKPKALSLIEESIYEDDEDDEYNELLLSQKSPIVSKKPSKLSIKNDILKPVETKSLPPPPKIVQSPIEFERKDSKLSELKSLTSPSESNFVVVIEKNSGNLTMLNKFFGKEYKYKFYNALEFLTNMEKIILEGEVYYSLKNSLDEIIYIKESDFDLNIVFTVEPLKEIYAMDGKYKIYKMSKS